MHDILNAYTQDRFCFVFTCGQEGECVYIQGTYWQRRSADRGKLRLGGSQGVPEIAAKENLFT